VKNDRPPSRRDGIGYLRPTLLFVLLAAAPLLLQGEDRGGPVDPRLVSQMAKALTNDARAQYELAQMYEQGIATPRDLDLAHLWYSKAANKGYRPAMQKLATWEAGVRQQRAIEEAERARKQAQEAAAARAAAKERAAQEAAARAKQEAEAKARAVRERAKQEAAAAQAKQKAAADAEAEAAREIAAQEAVLEMKRQGQPAAAIEAVQPPSPEGPVLLGPVTTKVTDTEAEKKEFTTNPCKGPAAKFTSTCQ